VGRFVLLKFRLSYLSLAAVLFTVFWPSASGQQITGSLTGSVTDPSGAAIVGSAIRLTNTGTGVTQTTVSDSSGNFQFLLLPPGTYVIAASNQGFKSFQRGGIIVEADRSMAVPVSLAVGAVTETVEVVGGTPLLEPNSSEIGTTVDSQKVLELPLNSRNPMGLTNLVPTAKGIGYFGQQILTSWRIGAVNIGGGQPLTSGFLLDGVPNDKLGDAAGANTFLTTDSTEEFKVITNSMSAEYGRTTGGVISVVSKSGSNSFHGGLFEYLQNTAFNANDFFANTAGTPLAPVHQHQFGGSLGGRIKRDKLFFFGNFEGFVQHLSATETINSPTALQRAGDFSKTFASNGQMITIYDPSTTLPNPAVPGQSIRSAFPGNVIPSSRISQFAKGFFDLYPMPNLPGNPVTGTSNLFLLGNIPTDRETGGVKVDWAISSDRRLSVRYTRDVLNESVPNGSFFQNPLDNDKKVIYVPRQSGAVSFTDSLSPTLLLDVRSGINRDYDQSTPWSYVGKYANTGFPLATLGLPQSLISQLQPGSVQFPGLTVADFGGILGGYGSAIGNRAAYTWGNVASITKILRGHTIKAGYQYTLYRGFPLDRSPLTFVFNRGFTQGPNPTVASQTSGYGLASLELGTAASGSFTWQPSHEQQELDHAIFAQDDWKISQKLTLNLGVRWEYQGPFTDRFNEMTNFDPSASSPLQVPGLTLRGGTIFPGINGLPRGVVDVSYRHFAPRFGFAYQALSKLVARGGYGIFWVPEKGILNPASTGFGITTTMNASLDNGLTPFNTIDNPFPNGLLLPTGSSQGLLTGVGTSVAGQLRDAFPGYAQQWNFTLQYSPWNNWLIEGAYLGNRGVHLETLQGRNLDQLDPKYFSLGNALNAQVPNPFYGIITSGPLSASTVSQQQLLLPYPQYTGTLPVNGGWSYLGDSIFHAFTLKVEKRFSQGFSILSSYTISKWIDAAVGSGGAVRTGGTPETGIVSWYNLRNERSKSIYDVPQRAVITALWQEPFFTHSSGWQRQVLGGWNLNGIMTIQSGQPIALQSGNANQRPNVVPGVDDHAATQSLTNWFNKAAFSVPAPFTFGDAGRTIPNLMSDGMFDLDASLYKTFSVKENYKFELKGEAFNLTNTPTFDVPGRDVTTQTFGVVTATALNPRPRSIQLSLRFMF
jgi:hypothetical protein